MRLIYNNLWDLYTLTESQEDANYPVENTQDVRLAKVWRTETASAASVVISAGSAALAVFQATTNLVSDPEDLTTVNWTEVNVTASLSDEYYDGKRFTKLLTTAPGGYIYETISFTGNDFKGVSFIARYGDDTISYLIIQDTTIPDIELYIRITWATQTIEIIGGDGALHDYDWIDDKTVEIRGICDPLNVANNIIYRLASSNNGKYTYFTAAQTENIVYPTPYTATSRAVTHPDETFEMPNKFTIDMIIKPWFTFDIASDHIMYSWFIDSTHRFHFRYHASGDLFAINWYDGISSRQLSSQVFDDGSAEVDINQRIRIIASIDLTTGTTAGSRLITEPLESGAIAEDTTWGGAIDALSSTFSTLSIGHANDVEQADSQTEYIRIYEGTLVGAVADSAAADALLAAKNLILDLTYLNKLTADTAAIVNHNLSADATIKIQGNDYDSWEGTPLDTEMTWRDGPIVTFMTSASYPFWRFYIINQNVEDGYYEVGRFMLGEYLQVDPSSLVEFPEKHVRNDRQAFSKSNQFYADQGSGWKELKYKFVNTNDTMKDKIETMWDLNGKHTPLLLMNYDTSFSIIPPLYCAIIKDITFGHLLHDRWEYNLDLRECD